MKDSTMVRVPETVRKDIMTMAGARQAATGKRSSAGEVIADLIKEHRANGDRRYAR